MSKEGDLTYKQRAFAIEFCKDFNGTRAAERAGYRGDDNVLAATASRLLRKVKVKKFIQEKLAAEAMTADEALWRLAEQARSDIGDFIELSSKSGNPILDLRKARDAGKLHLIKKLKYNRNGDPEIELYDQQAALVHLGRHLGLFEEPSVNVNIEFNLDEWQDDRRKRLNQVAQMPDSAGEGDEANDT